MYKLQPSDLADYLPLELPPGIGGAPGRGASRPGPATRGSTSPDPRVRIVSRPKRPDNFHQTILQPASLPKLKITQDLPLPDLVIKSLASTIEPPKPVPPPPEPAPAMLQAPIIPALTQQLPVRPPAEPVAVASSEPVPRLTQSLVQPISVPPPPTDPPAPAARPTITTAPSPPGKLVSLSVNPAPLRDLLLLPAGNREGAFTISAAGGQQGSPGGTTVNSRKFGTAGSLSAGDLSISADLGEAGGAGGAGSSAGGTTSIASGPGAIRPVSAGSLKPLDAEALVFPIDSRLRPRGPALIVSTGPGGGGGLGMYGILHGRRIYSVYLAMAPRNWILQFCVPEGAPAPVQPSRLVRLQLEPALTPPAALDKFDFHRPVLLDDRAGGMIILHGLIRKGGAVADLQLVRGVEPIANQAAIAAFARWRFSPALRAGKPIAVEVLVGIPIGP